jgi:hypothetical protein
MGCSLPLMTSPDYYRREAQRCRDLASGSPDVDMAKRWRALAADYENLAEAIENAPPMFQRPAVQRQPMQQQQKKIEDGE